MASFVSNEDKERIISDVQAKGVQFIDYEFVDILGTPKMCETTVGRLEELLTDGLWFDGSSIEGFVRISESDMFLKPDASTYAVLPWSGGKVARIICDVHKSDGSQFEGNPRYVLRRAVEKAQAAGFEYKVGPELEFFIFKAGSNGAIDPESAQVHDEASYFDLSTRDAAVDLRRQIVPALEAMGLKIEMSHHEVAPGQHEIDFRYGGALSIADSVQTYKTTVRTLAKQYGLHASFMPKPVYGINGSGMHVHQSLWRDGKNLFHDNDDHYHLSETAKQFVAGILHHARALCAITNPTINSYKRLVPGYEAPVYVCWGNTNRSALVRIPQARQGVASSTRAEVRFPDPSCNPYLAFAAMLYAGLDGIEKKMEVPKPVEENVYHFDDSKLREKYIGTLPGSLREAMDELAKDEVVKAGIGSHIYEKLTEAQNADWNSYRTAVTDWEKKRYFLAV